MRKSILVLVALALVSLVAITPAFAQARYGIKTSQPIETTGILNDADGNAMDYPVWIYGSNIFADEANSYMGIYDCDTNNELNASTIYPKDEIGEATQYDSATHWYTKPIYFSDGVGAIIFTGVGCVYYGPEPTN